MIFKRILMYLHDYFYEKHVLESELNDIGGYIISIIHDQESVDFIKNFDKAKKLIDPILGNYLKDRYNLIRFKEKYSLNNLKKWITFHYCEKIHVSYIKAILEEAIECAYNGEKFFILKSITKCNISI